MKKNGEQGASCNPYQPFNFDDFPQLQPSPCDRRALPLVVVHVLIVLPNMFSIKKSISILSSIIVAGQLYAADVTVHVSGYAEKPGRYQVPQTITVQELSKLFGGTVWGNLKRITIIRLERRSDEITGDAGNARTQVFKVSEITNNKGQLELMREDIIYVPKKMPL